MKNSFWVIISIFLSFVFMPGPADSQGGAPTPSPSGKGLFDSDEPLEITLKGKIRELLNDRSGNPKNFSLTFSYRQEDSSLRTLPVLAKTRGHFRRDKGNCDYPPLQIQFSGKDSMSLFPEPMKLKLVMPCQGEGYVVKEWLVYKLYNLVTPESFRARLVKIRLEDEKNRKEPPPFYGILLEDEKHLARRTQSVPVTRKIRPQQAMPESFLRMAVFEYLIGNTDWSVEYLQNVKLIARDSMAIPTTVPYDFDHAGIVNAPYALPAEQLQMSSVRERRYRGYCIHEMDIFDSTVSLYNRLKNEIYQLYSGCRLLDGKYIQATKQYLDAFYSTLNNPSSLQKEFGYPCDKNGTGNVIIRGLKED